MPYVNHYEMAKAATLLSSVSFLAMTLPMGYSFDVGGK